MWLLIRVVCGRFGSVVEVMLCVGCFFFFKHKTAYEMRISDWSSDVCSSDLWSIRQLEKIGCARQRWNDLRVDHASDFSTIAAALDHALLDDVPVRLFNFPLCTVPEAYRALAVPSISDWKRKYVPPCDGCSERAGCSGFFEWH